MKIQTLAAISICASGVANAAFTSEYRGKIQAVGCNATDNVCWVKLADTYSNSALPGCTGKDQVRWYGKTANGAVMTAMFTKAFLKGLTVAIAMDGSACFEGDPAYPKGAAFNIIDPTYGW